MKYAAVFLTALLASGTAAMAQPVLLNSSFEGQGRVGQGGVGVASQGYVLYGWDRSAGNTGYNFRPAAGTTISAYWDNGVQRHGDVVAIMQGPQYIEQTVTGFDTSKTYVLSFAANQRALDTTETVLSVQLDQGSGFVELLNHTFTGTGVEAQGNYTTPFTELQGTFQPTSTSLTIRFEHQNPVSGLTVLLDDVRLYEQSPAAPVVLNGSFEVAAFADIPNQHPGHPDPATTGQGRAEPAGWRVHNITGTQGYLRAGMNTGAPFFDNGAVPDGSQVLFLENETSQISQMVPGFTAGHIYKLEIAANSRSAPANDATLQVSIDGTPLTLTEVGGGTASPVNIPPVGGTSAFYEFEADFTAPASGLLELTIENLQPTSSLLVDDVRISFVAVPVELDLFMVE